MVYLGYNYFIPYFTDLHIFALMEPEFPEFHSWILTVSQHKLPNICLQHLLFPWAFDPRINRDMEESVCVVCAASMCGSGGGGDGGGLRCRDSTGTGE